MSQQQELQVSDLNGALIYLGNDPETIAETEQLGGVVFPLEFIGSFLVQGVKIRTGIGTLKYQPKFQINLTDLFGVKSVREVDGELKEGKAYASCSISYAQDWAQDELESAFLNSIIEYANSCEGKFDEKGQLILGGDFGGFLCQISPFSQGNQKVKYWGVLLELGEQTKVVMADGSERLQMPIVRLEIHSGVLIKQVYGQEAREADRPTARRSAVEFETFTPKKVISIPAAPVTVPAAPVTVPAAPVTAPAPAPAPLKGLAALAARKKA